MKDVFFPTAQIQPNHDLLFLFLDKHVKRLKGVSIITDIETAFRNAIESCTKMRNVGCWRHLRKDVERWLLDNIEKNSRSKYVEDLLQILRYHGNISFLQEKRANWNEVFRNYFDKYIAIKMKYFAIYAIRDTCPVRPNRWHNSQLNSPAEGFNFLLKDLQECKEAPMNKFAMSFKMLQGFYQEETRRIRSGTDNYVLRPKYEVLLSNIMDFPQRKLIYHPKDIVKSLQTGNFIPNSMQNERSSAYEQQ